MSVPWLSLQLPRKPPAPKAALTSQVQFRKFQDGVQASNDGSWSHHSLFPPQEKSYRLPQRTASVLSTLYLSGYMLLFHSPNAIAIISAQIYFISVTSLGIHLY